MFTRRLSSVALLCFFLALLSMLACWDWGALSSDLDDLAVTDGGDAAASTDARSDTDPADMSNGCTDITKNNTSPKVFACPAMLGGINNPKATEVCKRAGMIIYSSAKIDSLKCKSLGGWFISPMIGELKNAFTYCGDVTSGQLIYMGCGGRSFSGKLSAPGCGDAPFYDAILCSGAGAGGWLCNTSRIDDVSNDTPSDGVICQR